MKKIHKKKKKKKKKTKKKKKKKKKTRLKSLQILLCFCNKTSCCSKLTSMLHCDFASNQSCKHTHSPNPFLAQNQSCNTHILQTPLLLQIESANKHEQEEKITRRKR